MTAPTPKMSAARDDDPKDLDLRGLRRWHLGSASAASLPQDALPLLLAPFRDPAHVRHDYPIVLETTADSITTRPLGEALRDWAGQAKAQSRLIQDNLPRLERRVRVLLRDETPRAAGDLLREAGEQMIAEMQLRDEISSGVRADLDAMLTQCPEAQLLGLHGRTALQLLLAAARRRVSCARARYRERIVELADGVRQLLAVEAQKDPGAHAGDSMQKSLGAGARFLDPKALAKSVGAHRGTVPTDPQRRQRLQEALATLDGWLAAEPMAELVLTHRGEAPAVVDVMLQQSVDVCAGAVARFDHDAEALMPVVRAAYLADLETRGAFDAERHEPMLQAMDWRDLGPDELHALPAVVALAPAHLLAGHEMQALTGLLTSGRPVHVLVQETPAHDPAHSEGGHGDPLPARSRLELGYIGIAFREAYVQQTTAARPSHLARGFSRSLDSTRPGLHIVDSGLDVNGEESPLGAFLHAGAAIEGRAHPLFQYDPEAGETWARRLDFTLNPSPDVDWPETETSIDDERRPLRFTFADYALLDPQLRKAFTLVPDGIADGELIPIDEYLELDEDEARHRFPFVLVSCADDDKPQRAAMQRTLAEASRDRLHFWRTLQELAGVRNEHVREAVQRAREEAREQAEREREALQQQHAEDLAKVRDEAAGTAMQGLARMLLELDPMAELPTTAASSTAAAAAAAVTAEPEAEPEPEPTTAPEVSADEEDDDEISDEPWIETPRCSTCNDCVNMNSLLFVYDENKQATIGDPTAGSFAQLVQAAEKCPSRCIHPGKPQNPDEPDLDELIARAAVFN